MSKFDRIKGYNATKRELQQIADILKNRTAYDRLGVSVPRGLLLFGNPGVGKSLMASAVMEASERPVFTCRKDKPNGDFVKEIKASFDKAIAASPSIVYLDDMDKFANGDEKHPNAEEYVTVQSCIDEARGKDVFVLATANDIYCLPDSLRRAGRFDRIIEIEMPHGKDAIDIITHYLNDKEVIKGIDAEIIARIMDGHSCAELETVINEAGLYAGYERAQSITMEHFMKACLRMVFCVPGFVDDDVYRTSSDFDRVTSQIVYHEAGHAVISEILCPDSVTLVSAYNYGKETGGFTSYYNDRSYTPLYWAKNRIITSLGGMAAVEQKYGLFDVGSGEDLEEAFRRTKALVTNNCMSGFYLHGNGFMDSECLKSEQERAVSAEVEKYYRKAKEILSLNSMFFETIALALAEKKLLSALDIQKIKSECLIVPVSL